MIIRQIDPATIDGRELGALYAFHRRILAERSPDEPIPSLESFTANLRNIPPIMDITFGVAWDDAGENVLGGGNLVVPLMEGNEHLAEFELMVLPEQRGKGIGTELLRVVASWTRRRAGGCSSPARWGPFLPAKRFCDESAPNRSWRATPTTCAWRMLTGP